MKNPFFIYLTALLCLLWPPFSLPTQCSAPSAKASVESHVKAAGTSFRLVNVMSDFWKFWEKAERQDQATQVRLVRQFVIKPHQELYTQVLGDITDERLGRYVSQLAPLIPLMRRLGDKFPALLHQCWKSFAQVFPDIGGDITLYSMPSFGSFDGMSREFEGHSVLLFGIDQIVRTSGVDANLTPQIHHEIFHFYHRQVAPGLLKEKALYTHLWQEGLAVYVSKVLNPNATTREVYLSDFLPTEALPLLPRLAQELSGKLNSTSAEDERDFFNLSTKRKDIPPKSGYYIGMLLAQELAKKRTLAELTRLEGERLRDEIEGALREMGPAPITRER